MRKRGSDEMPLVGIMLSGEPKVVPEYEEEKRKFMEEAKAMYPHGGVSPSGDALHCKTNEKGKLLCMKCGHPLRDMSEYKRVKDEWVLRKPSKRSRDSCQVCFNCDPKGKQMPIGYGRGMDIWEVLGISPQERAEMDALKEETEKKAEGIRKKFEVR